LGGPTTEDNLALACVSCSLHKTAKHVVPDPDSGLDTPLYDPRTQRWIEHFRWEGVRVEGVTTVGRATIFALQMNRPFLLAIRSEEAILGRHPHV
jgi:hypothetical protein